MKRIWLKLLEVYYGQMAERTYRKYIGWRDKLLEVQLRLNPNAMSPERQRALRNEITQMMDDLDRQEATTLNELLDEVINEKEHLRWN